jgi:hypothetical protein
MPQITDPPLVLIEWLDSGQPIPRWKWLSDIKPRRPHRCISVGFLVQDDDETKTLAPNLGASTGGTDWDQASGLTTIPAAAVQRLERLNWSPCEESNVSDFNAA